MQVEKLAVNILGNIKMGMKPDWNDYGVGLEKFGEALQYIDSNNLATGINVKRTEAGKEIMGYFTDDDFSLTLPGMEFLEKNTFKTN
ncbi:YjcQ family protein [Domibacillus aminovorans]|uniref:Uncharacterized protein n=1 Tax=Domibacillus aminovorans TaxID=29332 RepID=A0A177L9Q2_9BACI|nr:hypothetical protein [Domibacillus aminovorans]OAH61371.1 hypothetical protein AWH49_13270 [Domibacillus aminovorans]